MHSKFIEWQKMLAKEQEKSVTLQHDLFQMIRKVQDVVINEAARSTRVFGEMSAYSINFHKRCIPEHSQNSYNIGIDAVKYREERNNLQKENKMSRGDADKVMKTKRLADLDVWENFVVQDCLSTARSCRAKTRQITSQLQMANKITKGEQNPLPEVFEVPCKTRDPNAPVQQPRASKRSSCADVALVWLV